jgi:hypothetical protein
MTGRLDVGALRRQLHQSGVDHIRIGGLAVNAWGVIRSTKDIDICPSPDPQNLERLAALLRRLQVRQLGIGLERFAEPEMPSLHRARRISHGGNFRFETPLGVRDIMQDPSAESTIQARRPLSPRSTRSGSATRPGSR